MNQHELPLGFGMALAQQPDAMKKFADLSEAEQADILQRAHSVSSKQEMRALVDGLSSQG